MLGDVKKVGMANVLSFPVAVFLFVRPDLDPTQANYYYSGILCLRQEADAKMEACDPRSRHVAFLGI
jgi:hypothetical protein